MEMDQPLWWKKTIQQWGYELGFVSIGFTTAEPIQSLMSLLQARMEQGVATPFEEKDIRRRVDPRAVWPNCQTVVVVAYPLPFSRPPQAGEGVLARSAVGEDYHHLLNRKLKDLVNIMSRNGWSGEFNVQVDTGPLIERAFALRAGIGWIGRNQQLIIPNYGSFAALGLLLLDQELPADPPLSSLQCGACQECLQACPAEIIGKEQFAANRCISYLTQSKEILKSRDYDRMGRRIFGCDTCQEVCPHNQKRIQMEQRSPSPLRRGVNLYETLTIKKAEFQQRFRVTAAGWRGKGVLQRNAFLALNTVQDARCQQWLEEHETDKTLPPILIPYLKK